MRKILTYSVSALALASCSSDSLVSDSQVNNEAPIAFNVGQRNITRAVDDSKNLEKNGYFDFGVFAYKVKSGEGATPELVMGNYKVAYTAAAGETPASWDYVGKVDGQVTRYWDYSTAVTNFYAYAPYVSGTKFDATNKTITVSSTAGYEAKNDVIYAGKSVEKDNGYGKNVPLTFKHVGAKVNIAFRENIDGYKVQLLNVETGKGVVLKPTGTYNATASVTINYGNPDEPTVNTSTAGSSSDDLEFDIFSGNLPEGADATYKASSTTYYAVIQPEKATNTFTLHVSYKLIADDNKEEIVVNDAIVTIPANQLEWKSNTAYTYNFTITDTALSPIVFDTPTIVDYEAATLDPSDTQI
ncbi:Fimbrillin-like [Prevotella sp. khp1]|nr:Fimbrillin-like [Prevotella sp. khp1]